jgi:hypothetical protein
MILNSPIISGSLTVTGNIISSGSITLSGSIASASYAATASFVALAQSASYVLTAQTASFVANAQTASFVALAQSASNAVSSATASFANAFTVASTLTAQTLVVQTITSSVDFVTGSTRFGSIAANTHQFTGSVGVEGTGIFYQPLTNSTSYLTVQNNRARNAAIYTVTTNGGFYAGTSIGTDTFNYQIYDGVAGAARLTIDSTGVASFTNTIKYTGTSQILEATSGTTGYLYQYMSNTGGTSYYGIERSTGGGLMSGASAYATVLGPGGATSLQFGTTGIIRMTITSGGQVTINAPTSGVGLLANGKANEWTIEAAASSTSGQSFGLKVKGGTTTSDIAFLVQNQAGSTDIFRIRGGDYYTQAQGVYNNTSATANYVVVTSDGGLQRYVASSQKYKEQILDWNTSGLDTILALKPKTFKYKKDYYDKADVDFLGLIAEEVAEVCPYLADYENEDRTGDVENVRYSTIVVPLISAIQELKTQNDALQSRIETLESK